MYLDQNVLGLSPGMFDHQHFMFFLIFMFMMTCWYWVWECSVLDILMKYMLHERIITKNMGEHC